MLGMLSETEPGHVSAKSSRWKETKVEVDVE